MKHLFFLSLTLLLISTKAYCQSPLPVGTSQFNVGVGLSNWGVPIYLGLDHSVHPDITLGGEISFRTYRENWQNNSYNHNVIGISANGNYHFNSVLDIPRTWDFYAGLNIGFYLWTSPNAYDGNQTSGLGLGAQIGGRYYLNDKVGLNLELGGGNTLSGGKFGLSVKL